MTFNSPFNRRQFLAAAGAAAVTPYLVQAAETDRPRIRVGQIGTKHPHAMGKLATLRKLSSVYEVVGIVEPDKAQRERMAQRPECRDLPWMTTEQLLHTPGLQAVAVETEVPELLDTAEQCVAAGMHLHLDKPAGDDMDQFRRLAAEAGKRKCLIQMGYMFRRNPAFRFLYQALADGWLGDVFEVHGVMSKSMPQGGRDFIGQFPGGVMFELGCHLVDAAINVLGRPEKIAAYPQQTRGDGVVDNVLAVFAYPRATATIRSSIVEIQGQQRRQFVVCGTMGVIDIRPLEAPRLRLALDQPRDGFKAGYQEVELPRSPGRYDEQLLHLARAIAGEEPFEYSLEHDLLVQECVLRGSGAWKE
ncbi:Gfo/Idh/MocA family protein [Lignipirellula cremea]|uniref:Putative oxidoreductase YdgJ n=1 Tax=Lignipirellula cremea TaxID=2528010 RepID=A0A518DVB5_9BACT|nr:Gfo/Idh/MocA family oxidoreductase [Lignipirellula cremea]QDU95778.1 putative oxidoreductase YdgJ [Lignipirellula cremea]